MIETKERIKQIRKEIKMTQSEFAKVIGCSQQAITYYETGLRTPSGAVMTTICREFNISENWLRTGEGEMHNKVTRASEIATITKQLFDLDEESFPYKFAVMLSKLDAEQWKTIENLINHLKEM